MKTEEKKREARIQRSCNAHTAHIREKKKTQRYLALATPMRGAVPGWAVENIF